MTTANNQPTQTLEMVLDAIEIARRADRTELFLAWANIDELPDSVCALGLLQKLVLDFGKLKKLPDSIGQLLNLQELHLAVNQLGTLPDSLGNLLSLKYLSLNENVLSIVPDSIGQLVNLNTLNLSRNQIQRLPQSLSQLVNLKKFHCSHNELTEIPSTFSQLENLEVLGLQVNLLRVLPDSLSKLSKLWGLYLDNNQLVALPNSFGQFNHMKRLGLKNNVHLVTLPIMQLDELDISGCRDLVTLPEGLVVRNALDLADTGLTSLPRSLQNTPLFWYGIPIDPDIALYRGTFTPQQILDEANPKRRRGLLERLGYNTFLDYIQPTVLDTQETLDIQRRLLRVELQDDEPFVCLQVHISITGEQKLMRVPPEISSCQAAVSWIGEFSSLNDRYYRPHSI